MDQDLFFEGHLKKNYLTIKERFKQIIVVFKLKKQNQHLRFIAGPIRLYKSYSCRKIDRQTKGLLYIQVYSFINLLSHVLQIGFQL